jgi:glucose-6-phosphate 1-dehydrogenase
MNATQTAPRPAAAPQLLPDDHVIVLFGATGDLAKRKLLPGLFHLAEAGLLPAGYRIVGTSRRSISDEEFRDVARAASPRTRA